MDADPVSDADETLEDEEEHAVHIALASGHEGGRWRNGNVQPYPASLHAVLKASTAVDLSAEGQSSAMYDFTLDAAEQHRVF